MRRIVFLGICLNVLFGCINQNGKENIQSISEEDFKEYIQLREERKVTKEILNVRNFFVQDSFLIINNSRQDSLFMVFDLSTFKCLHSWGRRGHGPNEHSLFTHTIKLSSDSFQIADFSRYRIDTYSLPKFNLVSGNKVVNERNVRALRHIPQKLLSDGYYYYYDYFVSHELFLAKWQNGKAPEEIYNFETYKELFKSSTSYWGCLGLNKERNRIVYAYRYLRRFDLLDLNGNYIKTVEINPYPTIHERGKNLDREKSTMCYMVVRTSKNSFFVYYIGYSVNELEDKGSRIATYIEEFDWDGNPINRYKLSRVISDFEIIKNNEEQVSFIAIDEENENPLIIYRKNEE
ncbi:MAG: BF3164 family lipoprotein [Mangrovibacterium sp.]